MIFISEEILGLPCEKYVNEILNSIENHRSSEITSLNNSLTYLESNSNKLNVESSLNISDSYLNFYLKTKLQSMNQNENSTILNSTDFEEKKKGLSGILKNENVLPFLMQTVVNKYFTEKDSFLEYMLDFKNVFKTKEKPNSEEDEKLNSYFSNDSISVTSYLKFNNSINSSSDIHKDYKRINFENKSNLSNLELNLKENEANTTHKCIKYNYYCSENLFSTLKVLQNFVEKIEKLISSTEILINDANISKDKFIIKSEKKLDADEVYLKFYKFTLLFKLCLNKQFDNQNSLEDNAKNLLNNDSCTLTSIDKLVGLVRFLHYIFSYLKQFHPQ